MKTRCLYGMILWAGLLLVLPVSAAQEKLFDYHQSTLSNGLSVVTLEDFSCPIIAVQVWYQVGSKDEPPDRQGYAHMFEHMMFKGTDRISAKDYFQLIHRTGGSQNANTWFDRTIYLETLPADQLELALWMEAERMAFLNIDQQNFDTERSVVEEELRRGENTPYGNLGKKLHAAVFKKHPYRWDTIGNIANLRATSVGDLRAFWEKYYVPSNATLIVVGAVKHEEVVKQAENYFGWIQKYPMPPRVTIREPLPEKAQTIIIDDENAPAPLVCLIFRSLPAGHKDVPALDFLAAILGGTNSSRLYRDLVAENQLAVQVSASNWNLQQDGMFFVDATLAPGSDPQPVLDKLKEHIKRIQEKGITADELETARNQQLRSVVTSNLTIDRKADVLGTAAVIVGDLSYANKILSQIREVTAQDVQRAACEYLRLDRVFEFIVKENSGGMKNATKDDESAAHAEPEKTAPPAGRAGEKRPDSFPVKAPQAHLKAPDVTLSYSEKTLKNGIQVMVVPNHEVPFVTVKFGLPFGAATESKPGSANLAVQMLTRGTKNRTEARLAEQLARYAIEINGYASMDDAQVNLSCLSEHLEKGMDLLADTTLYPTFDSAEFDKLRKQILADLAVQEKSPDYLADRELGRRLYGLHPYARTVEGQSKDIEKLTVNDSKTWWVQSARPNKTVLIFAGDIELAQAVNLAEKYFGNWKNNSPMMETKPAAFPQEQKTRIYLVDFPGSAQVQIRMGCRSMTRKDQPDYFTSRVVNTYFGASFNSWVNTVLREERGLTYSAVAYYSAQQQSGSFEVSTFTKNETTGQVISLLFDLLKRVRTEEPSVEDLNDSKQYICGSFVRRRETPQQTAGDLWLLESENLNKDYYEKLVQTVQNTTAQDCVKLADKTLSPENMVIVVVGDASKISTDLEKVGPVEIVKDE